MKSSEAITVINMNKEKLLSRDYRAFDKHHYFKPKIAKLHDTIDKDDQKGVFNSISQSVKSLIYHSIAYGKKSIYCPISVYKGIDGIYGVEDSSMNLDKAAQENHLVYGINYAYRSLRDGRLNKKMYYIDFVHESKLPDYLDLIDNEVDKLSQSLGSLFIMNLQNKG